MDCYSKVCLTYIQIYSQFLSAVPAQLSCVVVYYCTTSRLIPAHSRGPVVFINQV